MNKSVLHRKRRGLPRPAPSALPSRPASSAARRALLGLSLLIATLLSACSSGDQTAGVGTGGTGSLAKSVSGKVADGYLVNATVFLDRNGNYQWDAGEPFTTTDLNGAYTLQVDAADLGNYPIVALAIQGVTIDKDTNQTVANSYVLSMPKESVSGTVADNFISPITSQLREMMETGKYPDLQHAGSALAANLGLPPGTDLLANYLAANNAPMQTAAQNIATLMGGQMAQVLGISGSVVTVDVNRYRGMMGTIFSNMSSVRGPNNQAGLAHLNDAMGTVLSNTPPTSPGEPYRNMSSAFRGMMGGISTITAGMR